MRNLQKQQQQQHINAARNAILLTRHTKPILPMFGVSPTHIITDTKTIAIRLDLSR